MVFESFIGPSLGLASLPFDIGYFWVTSVPGCDTIAVIESRTDLIEHNFFQSFVHLNILRFHQVPNVPQTQIIAELLF